MRQSSTCVFEPEIKEQMLERLLRVERRLTIEQLDVRDRSYLLSYPAFLAFFENRSVIGKDDALIAANFTYAWMPTIARLNPDLLEAATAVLNRARADDSLAVGDIRIVKQFMNSMVAASKLLHFIAPASHAIFDSRVTACLKPFVSAGWCRTDEPEGYCRFLGLCKELGDDPSTEAMRVSLSQKFGYPITAYRTLEFLMFMAQDDENEG